MTKEVLDLSNNILEEMAIFFIKAIYEDNLKLCEMLKVIFDPSRTYFKLNNQDESPASSALVIAFYQINFYSLIELFYARTL